MKPMTHIKKFKEYDIWQDSSAESGDWFFYRMGRFFADPDVRKALGEPLKDSPQHRWLIVTTADGQIVAFSSFSFTKDGKTAHFGESYVLPEHRQQGIFAHLFELRQSICLKAGAAHLKGIGNGGSAITYERHNWQLIRTRGQWKWYEKEIQ